MRLIDADPVIKTIAGMQKDYPITDRRQRAMGIRVALFDCRYLIENQPIINNWIQTKNKLPEDADEVLTYCQDGTYRILWFDPECKDWNDINGYVCDLNDVVAWMYILEYDVEVSE